MYFILRTKRSTAMPLLDIKPKLNMENVDNQRKHREWIRQLSEWIHHKDGQTTGGTSTTVVQRSLEAYLVG